MLANFVLKQIDTFLNQKLSLEPQKKLFTKDVIRQNLQNVIKKRNQQISFVKQQNVSPNNKSRLRSILQHNKQEKIRSVVKKNKDQRFTSSIQYSKITKIPSMKLLKNQSLSNSESLLNLKKDQSLIQFYRQQRKTFDKKRLNQSQIYSKNRQRIFQVEQNSKQNNIQKIKNEKIDKMRQRKRQIQKKIYRNGIDVDLFHTKNMIGLEPYNKLRRFE